MRPLSMDLRERIVAAYGNKEGSYLVLAARFAVSRAVVGKLVRQHREQGTLEPQVHLRGRKPAIGGKTLERLRKHLAEHPDATLEERIAALGLDCAVNTMWKTLRRLGWRYKKSRREPRNRIAQTWPKNGRTGTLVSTKSIPSVLCSSTRQGSKPTCPGFAVGPKVAHA